MSATEFGKIPGFPRLEIPVFGRRKGTEADPQADSQRQHVHRAACAWVLLVFVFGSVAVNHGKEGGLLFLRHPGNGKGIEKSRNDSFFLCTILPLCDSPIYFLQKLRQLPADPPVHGFQDPERLPCRKDILTVLLQLPERRGRQASALAVFLRGAAVLFQKRLVEIAHIRKTAAETDVKPLAQTLLDMGARAVLIKCGTAGMYYRTADLSGVGARLEWNAQAWSHQEGIQPCFKADVVRSATGAGDTSIAAFLTGILRGKSPGECAALAAAEGACAVTAYDALGGLKPIEELEARIAAGWQTME